MESGVYLENARGSLLPLISNNIILGRNSSCHVVLTSKYTSSLHARLVRVGEKYVLIDLNSANGLFVNDEKVSKKTLKDGDRIRLADEEFVFLFRKETIKIEKTLTGINRPLSPFDIKIDHDQSIFIFENKEDLVPVIDYSDTNSEFYLEAIVFNEQNILSIEYINLEKNTKIHLSNKERDNHIFIPISASIKDFIVYKNNSISIKSLDIFEEKFFRGEDLVDFHDQITLKIGDYYLAEKDDVKISICLTNSPPLIKPPPFLTKDKFLRRLLFLGLFLWVLIFSSFKLLSIEKPIIKRVKPKRIQKILYRPKKKIEELKKTIKTASQQAENIPDTKKMKVDSKVETKTKKQKEVTKPQVKKLSKKTKVTKIKEGSKKVSNKVVKSKKTPVQRKFNFTSQVKALQTAKSGLTKLSAQSGSGNVGSTAGIETSKTKGSFGASRVDYSVGTNVGKNVGLKKSGTKGIGNSKGFFDSEILSETVVLGAMDPNLVREILRSYLPQFRFCYDQELIRQNKKVKGTVVYNFIIGPSGRTSRIQIGFKEFRMSRTGKQCMINVLKSIQFPKPKGGGIVEIRVPIYMEPEF